MDYTDRELIDMFERAFGEPKDALHTLAERHPEVGRGVLDYWAEKLVPIVNDVNMIRRANGLGNMQGII